MLLVQTEQLRAGVKLAKPIYTNTGGILISVHAELTTGMIRKLREMGISTVYIQDERTEDIRVENVISDETWIESVSVLEKSFKKMRDIGNQWGRKSSPHLAEFRGMFERILSEMESKQNLLVHMSSIYTKDIYLYSHAINVGIYSAILGISLKLNQSQILDLGVGAMLHDLGKTFISPEILMKPGRLSVQEFETMQTHTTLGYQLLRKTDDVSLMSAHCAMQHHERLDGSGYPRQLRNDEIHLYGRIVGICDTYNALVSNRSYRKAELPHTALEMLYAYALVGKFDLSLVDRFQKYVVLYPIGLSVILSTGERGIVSHVHASFPSRPVIRVLANPAGEPVAPYERDLSRELTVMISSCDQELFDAV
ncbi:MAG: hypothetical protein JWN30_1410 [Bacilli bacterium]|nr:hypothetical protein [Bacilli bacterium]